MKRKILILIPVFISCLHYNCGDHGANNTVSSKKINADSPAIMPDHHNSANSLDWHGMYKGTLPCADCAGIETAITLNKDNTYSIKTKYLGKADKEFEEQGSITWNTGGNTITLSGIKSKPNQYFVGENKILQLDMTGNKITGASGEKYVLAKQINTSADTASPVNAELVETYWKLIELMGKPVKTEEGKKEIHIILKSNENRIQGFAGCNNISGVFELKAGNFISFQKIASTLMACVDMEKEDALKEVLERTDNYSILGNNLSLNKARMAPLARFEAVYLR